MQLDISKVNSSKINETQLITSHKMSKVIFSFPTQNWETLANTYGTFELENAAKARLLVGRVSSVM